MALRPLWFCGRSAAAASTPLRSLGARFAPRLPVPAAAPFHSHARPASQATPPQSAEQSAQEADDAVTSPPPQASADADPQEEAPRVRASRFHNPYAMQTPAWYELEDLDEALPEGYVPPTARPLGRAGKKANSYVPEPRGMYLCRRFDVRSAV